MQEVVSRAPPHGRRHTQRRTRVELSSRGSCETPPGRSGSCCLCRDPGLTPCRRKPSDGRCSTGVGPHGSPPGQNSSAFIEFCQDKIQEHSTTFQGLNFSIQGLFERAQINLLSCKLNVLINIVVSVVDKCR